MTIRPTALAALGLAAFGLAACDSADGPAAAPDTATSAFDASVFPEASQVIVVRNRANDLGSDRILRYRSADALARKSAFFRQKQTDVVSFQTAKLEEFQNEFFGTFDLESGGRIERRSRQGAVLAQNDATLISPKGFDIGFIANVTSDGRFVLVADVGQAGIIIFDGATLSPIVALSEDAGIRAWDVHYDQESGFVFAANTNGTVSVYNLFAPTLAPLDVFQVMDADGNPAINNHGITFDPESNTLIVSDVGLAGNPDDGTINVIDYDPDAGSGGSAVMARATYAGANTMLGNPVDIAGSGSDLFVAEKANGGGLVMRFADVLTATGTLNVAPASMDMDPNPESVDVFNRNAIGQEPAGPGGIGRQAGGTIFGLSAK